MGQVAQMLTATLLPMHGLLIRCLMAVVASYRTLTKKAVALYRIQVGRMWHDLQSAMNRQLASRTR